MEHTTPLDEKTLREADRDWHALARRVRNARGLCFVVYFVSDAAAADDIRDRLREYVRGRGASFVLLQPVEPEDVTRQVLSTIYSSADILSSVARRPVFWVDLSRGARHEGWQDAVGELLMRLNEQRSRLENEVASVLVLVLGREDLPMAGNLAPDLWHIRAHSRVIERAPFDIIESVVADDSFEQAREESPGRLLVSASQEIEDFDIHTAWPIQPPALSEGLLQWTDVPLEDWLATLAPRAARESLMRAHVKLRLGELNEVQSLLSPYLVPEMPRADGSAVSESLPAAVSYFLGMLGWARGDHDQAARSFARALEFARIANDPVGQFIALDRAGCALLAKQGAAQAANHFIAAGVLGAYRGPQCLLW
jgi:hypothetical protein